MSAASDVDVFCRHWFGVDPRCPFTSARTDGMSAPAAIPRFLRFPRFFEGPPPPGGGGGGGDRGRLPLFWGTACAS